MRRDQQWDSSKDESKLAPKEPAFLEEVGRYFDESVGTTTEKLTEFTKYVPRQKLSLFLYKYEVFKRILNVQGSIIECGVFHGGGLMAWANLSAILEPYNHQRRVVGFDTFEGYRPLAPEDRTSTYKHMREGGLAADSYEDLTRCIALFDRNRPISHIPKAQLVRGDLTKTAPAYLEANPHTVVSLLYLDLNVYEPSRAAIEHFLPRMPKGAVIAFDSVNSPSTPGETLAPLGTVGLRNLRLERLNFDSMRSFAVLE
jgi:hypothetical protein